MKEYHSEEMPKSWKKEEIGSVSPELNDTVVCPPSPVMKQNQKMDVKASKTPAVDRCRKRSPSDRSQTQPVLQEAKQKESLPGDSLYTTEAEGRMEDTQDGRPKRQIRKPARYMD